MYIDKKILYIILGLFILSNLFGLLTDQEALIDLLLTLPAVLVAITFHEFAHGYTADKLGDDTPRRQGRLNLNPISHLDPIGTIMLVFAGFGWGKPVEINPRNFNRNIKMQTAEAIVAAAGPITNIVLAFILTVIYTALWKYSSPIFLQGNLGIIVMNFLVRCVAINIGLGIFNLIPLPPLDGSKILASFLPYNAREWFEKYYSIFYGIFVVIWVTGLAGIIIAPVISAVCEGIISVVGLLFGI